MRTRFVLQDGSVAIFECVARDGRARVIVDNGRLDRVAHYAPGIPDVEAIAAVDAFRAREYAEFLQWAARKEIEVDASQYPPPRPIALDR
jgi:hypothetical protein